MTYLTYLINSLFFYTLNNILKNLFIYLNWFLVPINAIKTLSSERIIDVYFVIFQQNAIFLMFFERINFVSCIFY